MSIKGFKVKGQVEKYDYQSLDNLPFFNEISNWGVKVVPYAPGALFVKDAGATISHLHQDVHVIADMPIEKGREYIVKIGNFQKTVVAQTQNGPSDQKIYLGDLSVKFNGTGDFLIQPGTTEDLEIFVTDQCALPGAHDIEILAVEDPGLNPLVIINDTFYNYLLVPMRISPIGFTIKANDQFTYICDGVEGTSYWKNDGVNYYIGNLFICDNSKIDTGEQFCLIKRAEQEFNLYFSEEAEHEFSLSLLPREVPTKLDYQFLPDNDECFAEGHASHVEGIRNRALGQAAHAEGVNTIAESLHDHAEGYYTHAKGGNSHAEGANSQALGMSAHAEGFQTVAQGNFSHSEGALTKAIGEQSHAEGVNNTASGPAAHAEGGATKAIAQFSHAEGIATNAMGDASHAEGNTTTAVGTNSHSEGMNTTASGIAAHAEGASSIAKGEAAHAEGAGCQAIGVHTHAEGFGTQTTGTQCHAEGSETISAGFGTHTEGIKTQAYGDCAHAEGWETIARGIHQHVEGRYNIEDTENKYAHIVGNGDPSKRSNAYTLDWDGNAWYKSDVRTRGLELSDIPVIDNNDYKIDIASIVSVEDEIRIGYRYLMSGTVVGDFKHIFNKNGNVKHKGTITVEDLGLVDKNNKVIIGSLLTTIQSLQAQIDELSQKIQNLES